jgi:fructose-1-phosphate kinase PfkB-like protein
LESQGVETDFIEISGDTRINVKLKSKEETEINGAGPVIKDEDLNKLFKIVTGSKDLCKKEDIEHYLAQVSVNKLD